MEKSAPLPNSLQANRAATANPSSSGTQKKKIKLPTPHELISHYESQCNDPREASIKVIEDLQNTLLRVISSGRGQKDKLLLETARKIDVTNNRVAILDLKLNSKPGYAETFAIGLASGSVLKGIGSVMPHALRALSQIWNSVSNVTKDSS